QIDGQNNDILFQRLKNERGNVHQLLLLGVQIYRRAIVNSVPSANFPAVFANSFQSEKLALSHARLRPSDPNYISESVYLCACPLALFQFRLVSFVYSVEFGSL